MSQQDRVDLILAQWAQELPHVDASPMAVVGRVSRLARQLERRVDGVLADHGLASWEFDVLATLRRAGAPFELPAGAITDSTMITSGSTTHRLDRLEERRLVTRRRDPEDARRVLVGLTDAGRDVVEQTVVDHYANEEWLLSGLDAEQREQLADLLRRLALTLDC